MKGHPIKLWREGFVEFYIQVRHIAIKSGVTLSLDDWEWTIRRGEYGATPEMRWPPIGFLVLACGPVWLGIFREVIGEEASRD